MPKICQLYSPVGPEQAPLAPLTELHLFPSDGTAVVQHYVKVAKTIFAKFQAFRGGDTTQTSAILSDGRILSRAGTMLALLPVDPLLLLLPLLLPTVESREFRTLGDLLDVLLRKCKDAAEKKEVKRSYDELFELVPPADWELIAEHEDICGEMYYRLSTENLGTFLSDKVAVASETEKEAAWALLEASLPPALRPVRRATAVAAAATARSTSSHKRAATSSHPAEPSGTKIKVDPAEELKFCEVHSRELESREVKSKSQPKSQAKAREVKPRKVKSRP